MTDQTTTLRRQRKQLLRSWDSCRASKIKCIPTINADANERCPRCARLGKQCVFSEMRERPKKGKPSQARISEVEKKIDDVYHLLQTGLTPQNDPTPQVPEQTSLLHQPVEPSPVDSGLGYSVDFSQFSQGEKSSSQVDVIQKGIIPIQEAEELIEIFRMDYANFPFVLLPHLTMDSFQRERPFLLLSVLTITSRKQFKLQERLEREFREVLSTKIIVKGAKDLDLLHGLLLYLAWYHFQFKLQGGQMNMLVQIAVAMTLELDLGKPGKSTMEAQRAFVGTYYLSSCLSMVNRKPITMKYNDEVGDCCRSLATGNETPSDTQLIHFVELQRLAEEIALVFGDDPMNVERLWIGVERADLLIKAFKSRLQHLRGLFPQDGFCLHSIILAYDSTCIHLHQVSLHVSLDKSPSTSLDSELHKHSGARMILLIDCLEATKSFLDRYLQLSPYMIEHHSMLEKCPVAQAILVLIKLAFCTNSPEPFPLRQTCNVRYYLDALEFHVGSISVTPAHAEHHDSFYKFRVVAKRVKSWYERAESSEPTIFSEMKPSELKEPLQLAEIAKNEEALLKFDIGSMDFLFVEGNNFWECP